MLLRSKQLALANSNINTILIFNLVSDFLTKQFHFEIVHAFTRDNQRLCDEFHYFQMHLHNVERHQ